MYFLYLDESGNNKINKVWYPESDFFLLGGVIVNEKKYVEIESAFIDFKKNNFPEEVHSIPIHAVDLNNVANNKKNPYYNYLKYSEGKELLKKTYEFVSKQDLEMISVTIDNVEHRKQYCQPDNPYELSYRFILERFQKIIKRDTSEELGQVYLSESNNNLKCVISDLHEKLVLNGSTYMDFPQIFKSVNISPVKKSCFFELADLICYAYQRAYSNFIKQNINKKIYDSIDYLDIISDLAKAPVGRYIYNKKVRTKIFPKKRDFSGR